MDGSQEIVKTRHTPSAVDGNLPLVDAKIRDRGHTEGQGDRAHEIVANVCAYMLFLPLLDSLHSRQILPWKQKAGLCHDHNTN
jgi:hypothetical protein